MEKKSSIMLVFISSKHEPSAEGAAKIFETFIPQMEKKKKSCLHFFFHLNRDLQPKALRKYLKSWPTNEKKKINHASIFFSSKYRPSAEGAVKIFEKFIPQMEKII